MSRDDSMLYAGSSSVSTPKDTAVKKARAEKREETKAKRLQLQPYADIVKAEIQKEIYQLKNIDYLNIESMMTDEHFKAELMSRKKTIEKLQAVQSRLDNILREHK